MYAVDSLIERFEEQIELAPKLQENHRPGGRLISQPPEPDYGTMRSWLMDGINRAHHIQVLQAVESGARRYRRHLEKTLEHVAILEVIFAKLHKVQAASFEDGAQHEKGMAQFKDTPSQICAACKSAIAELQAARKVLEEGERKEAKLSAAGIK